MKHVAAVALFVSAVAVSVRSQQPATTIRGRVVADDTGNPVVNARVAVISSEFGAPVMLTDDDGRFTLTGAGAGARLAISKTGYSRREVRPSVGADIRLERAAVISGRVVDEFGDPVLNARIMAHVATARADEPGVAATLADDRGEYRLAGLPGGTYLISTTTFGEMTRLELGNGGVALRPTPYRTYYPEGSSPSEAQPLRLQPGDDRPRVDLVVPFARSSGGQPGIVMPFARPPSLEPAEESAVIRGRVVGTGGRVLARAQIRVNAARDPREVLTGRTGADGQFEFRDLPAGKYAIAAAKVGYSPAGASLVVDVAEGESKERVEIGLSKLGSIAGRIVDEHGDPVQGTTVQTLQVRYERGRRRLVAAGGLPALSDDLGRYRVYNVPPGQFVVSASGSLISTMGRLASDLESADLPGYARVFYPGTPNAAQAQFVSMSVSQDVTGIDMALSRTRTARITGKMLDAAGEPTMGGSVTLLPSQASTSVTYVGAGARIRPDGQFGFTNVAPGKYVIQASRGRNGRSIEGEFGTLPVAVDGVDVTGLMLRRSAGSSIKGRFTFDTRDPSKTPVPRAIELTPIPVDADLSPASVASADIHEDWTFDIGGINGPRRLQLVVAPRGWMLKEVRVSGIDATDRVLAFGRSDQSLRDVEVVLTDRISELNGTVANDAGEPAPGSHVVVFSTDRSRWYVASRFLRTAGAEQAGAFAIAGLPFGTYYAAAVARLPVDGEDAWQDPEFLNALLRRASSVTVRDGEKQTINLRVADR